MTLNHNNAGSSTGNKIFCPGGVDLVITPYGSANLTWISPGAWYVDSYSK